MSDRVCTKCGGPLGMLDPLLGMGEACARCLLEAGAEEVEGEAPEDPPTWTAEVRTAMADPGNVFGRYVRLKVLGEGSFGAVYLARDLQLGRDVALKVMRTQAGSGTARMKREARVLAGLRHPNIAAIFETGSAHGAVWIAMEFVDGRTMAGLTPAAPEAARLIRDAARAVQHAHDLGVIHRDIKPGNLMVDREGRVFVMDFGLARSEKTREEMLTESGLAVGTPSFMSPEQAEGHAHVDGRTDVYGLGASLYALACGRPPFSGPTAAVIGKVILDDPVRPRKSAPKCPEDLETIVMKCLEKRPEMRYATAGALAEDLERFMKGEPILARPAGIATRLAKAARRNPAAAWAVAALLLTLFGFASWLAGSTAWGAVERRRLVEEFDAAALEGRWEEALTVATAGQRAFPGHETFRWREREALMGRQIQRVALKAAEYRSGVQRLRSAYSKRAEAEAEVMPWTAPSELRRYHEARAHEADQRRRVEGTLRELEVLLQEGRKLNPEEPRMKELALGLWVAGFQAANASGDQDLAEMLRASMARGTGDDPAQFEAKGRLRILSAPADVEFSARLYVFQKVEERLIPIPLSLEGQRGTAPHGQADPVEFERESDSPEVRTGKAAALVAARTGTSAPLALLEGFEFPANRLAAGIPLPLGSYLLVIQSALAGEIRHPFRILPPDTYEARIEISPLPLWRESALHHEFIRVPAGDYIRGRDPLAPDTPRKREDGVRKVEEFLISKFEVTAGQYAEFLNDGQEHSQEEAWRRVPRSFGDPQITAPDWTRESGVIRFGGNWRADWPIAGISAFDADAFARWLTRRSAPPGWKIQLPTEDEWEKAARGVDGREYPWGRELRRSFCATQRSRRKEEGERSHQPIGMFPVDESVYGVRDLAGNMAEWTRDPAPDPGLRIFKGGNAGRLPDFCRAASREHGPEAGEEGIGIRLVAVPVEPK